MSSDDVRSVERGGLLDPGHHQLLLREQKGPSGFVTPREMRLRLTRTDEIADAFAHVHEAHHLGLNDTTAWGSVLHLVAAAEAEFGASLGVWVEECRVTHESYATYAAMSVVEARFGPQRELLALWPDYGVYLGLLERLVDDAGGPQRRYLLATVIARICMQCPVGEPLVSAGPGRFVPSVLRTIDRPDGRFRFLSGLDRSRFVDAARTADSALPRAVEVDVAGADALAVADDDLDGLWRGWEIVAYEVLAEAVAAAGGDVLSYDGHLEFTDAMVAVVAERAGPIRLRGQRPDEPSISDLHQVSSLLVVTHEELVDVRYPTRTLRVDVEDVAGLVDTHSRIAGVPTLVLSALLPDRLKEMYRWDDDSAFASAGGVVWGVRLIESGDDGGSSIVWIPIEQSDLAAVVELWGDRGPAIGLVAASCLIDVEFQRSGLWAVRDLVPTLMRVDVTPDRLLPSWTRSEEPIALANVRVEDTGGDWRALVFVAVDDDLLWFVVGTEATVGLYRQGLETASVTRLTLDTGWEGPLRTALTATLALDTSLSFDGVEART